MPTIRSKYKGKSHKELETLDKKWEMQFHELQKFKKKFGHCDVPKSTLPKYKRYSSLANWCVMQRHLRRFSPLKFSPDRMRKLNEIGFCWDRRNKMFEENFRKLQKYRQQYGHCKVDWSIDHSLHQWCVKLRIARKEKAEILTKERIARLTKLGFSWQDLRKERYELLWNQKFDLLKKYWEKYGHCNVPFSKKDSKINMLACWADKQREDYRDKNESMTAEKIAKLNSIGFSWDPPFKVGERHMIQEKDLLSDLKRLYKKRGMAPSGDYIKAHGKYSSAPYIDRYGSVANACKAAGIDSRISRIVYSDAELLDDLKRIATKIGRIPNNPDVKKHGKYTSYYSRFGNLAKALAAAGITG